MNGKLQLSKRDKEDLLNIIDHTRRNLSWGEGGSFIDDDGNSDPKQAKSAERGIELIKQLVILL